MQFPNQSTGRPWARLDARTGMMFVSGPDGKAPVDLKGKIMSVNIAGAQQGWLAVTAAGADFQPIIDGKWGNPPSPDHKPGVDVELYCKDAAFGDAPVRVSRGNSKGWTGFIAGVSQKAGDIPAGKWPTIRIDGVKVVKIGQGSSINVEFTVAPTEKWAAEADIRAAADAARAAPKPEAAADDDEF